MKRKHTMPRKPVRDFSFARFFNPEKSPHTVIGFNPIINQPYFVYAPIHNKKLPDKLAWDSKSKGTYKRSSHGVLR
jgi:hypothetical protein